MHNFLFGNKRRKYSSYNPFVSQRNLKPGIITKIKNKIQGLFQPTINQQSLIQRIEIFEDQNLEQELSYQFKNNLVLVDRIIPNKIDNKVSQRKSICPFEQYLKEEIDTSRQFCKETQNDLKNNISNSNMRIKNSKKKEKFKKDHQKIYKSRKMEENQKQLEFNLKNQNSLQNFNEKYENSLEYKSNKSNELMNQCDSSTESSILIKQQKDEKIDYLSPVKIIENQSIIQNCVNKNNECDSFLKRSSSPNCLSNKICLNIDLNLNPIFSSSTGNDIKGQIYETYFNCKTDHYQQEELDNKQILDSKIQFKMFKQDTGLSLQKNKQFDNNFIQKQENPIKQRVDQDIVTNQNDEQLDNRIQNAKSQKFETKMMKHINKQGGDEQKEESISILQDCTQKDLQFQKDEIINNLNNPSNQIFNQILISSQIEKGKELKIQQNINPVIILQDEEILNQNLISKIDKQNNFSEKTQKLQESQKKVLQNSLLNNQNNQSVDNNEKLLKQQNPFLIQSPQISYDQISLYFQSSATSNDKIQYQSQNQNSPIIDLFKISAQQPQQVLNKVQDQSKSQDNIINENPLIFQQTNVNQMEVVEQVPQINQICQNQNIESFKLNYQQELAQENNLIQQQQQQQQHYQQQQMQQQNLQIQNIFPFQKQSYSQISSLNLFLSQPNQQEQNDFMNKSLILKNDVLSLFQDTKKSDRDIFQIHPCQQKSQSLNNSFNKSRKKQRINYL